MDFTLAEIDALTRGRLGVVDAACPACGPDRRSAANRVRRVLRVWRHVSEFATFACARCDLRGYARDGAAKVDPGRLDEMRAAIAARDKATAADRLALARRLADRRRPASGTIVETYLREVRGYGGAIPVTLGFLPATDRHPPAMIGLFGLPDEPEPGSLHLPTDRVVGVHLTRLRPDGRGKAGEPSKIMLGRSLGSPIILAPLNEGLGLVVTEGIETGLSLLEATGLGVWAAGAAGRMPALANVIPAHVDCITIAAEPDEAGRKGAGALADQAQARGLHVEHRILDGGIEARAA